MSTLNPRFSGTGHGDKTAVQLMSEYDSLPAVCNCCSTHWLILTEERRGEKTRGEEKKTRVRTQECRQLPNDLK